MENITKVCHKCGISYGRHNGRHNCGVATWYEELKYAKIKKSEYVEAKKLAEALMDMVDDYEEKLMYADLRRQLKDK